MREKVYFIRYLMSTKSAATSMLFVVGLTFIMGLTRQVPSGNKAVRSYRFNQYVVVLAPSFSSIYG